jgi:hypothetical protein
MVAGASGAVPVGSKWGADEEIAIVEGISIRLEHARQKYDDQTVNWRIVCKGGDTYMISEKSGRLRNPLRA